MSADEIEGVRRTLALYCQLMDDGHHDEAVDLFDDDGCWTIQGATHQGINEIREMLSSMPLLESVKHVTTNSVIDIDGEVATAVSDFLVVRASDIGGVVLRAGRYHDSLRRSSSGRWKFVTRENRGTSFVSG